MKSASTNLTDILTQVAISGNILFALWILYNGISENFQGTTIEKISYLTLIALLSVNAFLLLRNRRLSLKSKR